MVAKYDGCLDLVELNAAMQYCNSHANINSMHMSCIACRELDTMRGVMCLRYESFKVTQKE